MFVPTEGAVVADRYLLVREIGRGGMGSIWQGIDQQLEAPCALKLILATFAAHPELRSRIVREARAVASLQSPHLVSIRGVGEFQDCLYIAMELLDGETLQQRLDREGKLSPELTINLVEQVASVLAKAHAAGIVHRDLKPDNIWLWADSPLFIKLLDFGVAKHVLESANVMRTATGTLVGTPHYMSPEQAEGSRDVDHRTDVWALGIIALECLTGNRPFEGSTVAELLLKIARLPLPSINQAAPEFPQLHAFWERVSARALDQRFPSVRELAQQLRRDLTLAAPAETRPLAVETRASSVNQPVHLARTEAGPPAATAQPVHSTLPLAVATGNRSLPPWLIALSAGLVGAVLLGVGFGIWHLGASAGDAANPSPLAASHAPAIALSPKPAAPDPVVTLRSAPDPAAPLPGGSTTPSASRALAGSASESPSVAANSAPRVIPKTEPAPAPPRAQASTVPKPNNTVAQPARPQPTRARSAVDGRLGF